LVSESFAFQEPAPGVIHALLVADSDSSLGDSVKHDVSSLSRTLTWAFADNPSRLQLTPLMGSSVTVSAIQSFFETLRSGPDDTLLFYYSGHGEIRPELGHVLNLTNPDEKGRKVLSRFDLLTSMKAKKPRLIVLLTDCCSAIRQPPVAQAPQQAAARDLAPPPRWAVAGCLFLQHRGVVDITASCPGQAAWPNSLAVGGIFTETFVRLLDRFQFHSLDKNKDRFVEWNEFYPELEKQAQQGFVYLQRDLKQKKRQLVMDGAHPDDALSEEENQAILQPTQKSWTFSILPFLRVGVRVLDSPDGLKLEEIYPGTPASAARGLKTGVTIVSVGDKLVQNERDFLLAVDATPGDKPLVLKVKEPGAVEPRIVTIKLRDNDVPADVRIPPAPIAPPVPRP
jgi:hypothetical protein